MGRRRWVEALEWYWWDQAASKMTVSPGAKILSLPCGTGWELQNRFPGSETYGIEEDWTQADEAATKLAHVIRGNPFHHCKVSDESFGFVLCRPPHAEGDDGFLEMSWIRYARTKLAPDGIAALVLPCETLSQAKTARSLLGWSEPVWRGQATSEHTHAILLVRRRRAHRRPEEGELQTFIAHAGGFLPGQSGDRLVVPATKGPEVFHSRLLDPLDVLKTAAGSPVWGEFRTAVDRRKSAVAEMPPLPLRQGHVALQLATGRLDGVIGEGDKRHVVKGRVIRRLGEPEEALLDDGRTEEVRRESLAVEITALDAEGRVFKYTSEGEEGEA